MMKVRICYRFAMENLIVESQNDSVARIEAYLMFFDIYKQNIFQT